MDDNQTIDFNTRLPIIGTLKVKYQYYIAICLFILSLMVGIYFLNQHVNQYRLNVLDKHHLYIYAFIFFLFLSFGCLYLMHLIYLSKLQESHYKEQNEHISNSQEILKLITELMPIEEKHDYTKLLTVSENITGNVADRINNILIYNIKLLNQIRDCNSEIKILNNKNTEINQLIDNLFFTQDELMDGNNQHLHNGNLVLQQDQKLIHLISESLKESDKLLDAVFTDNEMLSLIEVLEKMNQNRKFDALLEKLNNINNDNLDIFKSLRTTFINLKKTIYLIEQNNKDQANIFININDYLKNLNYNNEELKKLLVDLSKNKDEMEHIMTMSNEIIATIKLKS